MADIVEIVIALITMLCVALSIWVRIRVLVGKVEKYLADGKLTQEEALDLIDELRSVKHFFTGIKTKK